jgi:monoamine oxidase
VIGAGPSGLAAARKLKEAGKSFVVLEARDRVGGKVLNHSIGHGEITEAGATYIGPTQHRMVSLAAEYAVDTYPTYYKGRPVSIIDGKRVVGEINQSLALEYRALVKRLDAMAAEVPVAAPGTAAHAREWDSQTFYGWLKEQNASPGAMELIREFTDPMGVDARDVSLLFAVYYIAGAGDQTNAGTLERLLSIQGGAQELRFTGGSQVLMKRIAASLGDRVILSAPVHEIAWDNDGVVVKADGRTVEAKRVIIAFAPALAARLRYEPKLPVARAQFLQRYPMASMVKVEAVYREPFWRKDSLSGMALIGADPVHTSLDNTPPAGHPGILIGFVSGSIARHWSSRPEKERRSAVLANYAAAFGDEALNPIEYLEFDWNSEEWSGGGPVGYGGPGVLLDYGSTIRTPVGPIHWAGTETATYWNGYMEGAVEAGERAAAEVLGSL